MFTLCFKAHKQVIITLLLGLILVLSIEVVVFRLWAIDMSVPFNYWGDTLWFVVPIKGMIENGWTYNIPQLSAPFGLSASGFPSMTNLDWLIMKAISLLVTDAGAILNFFWLFSIALTVCSSIISLHLLGVNKLLSLIFSISYGFLPFAILRNVAHICLVYYCVPLLCLFSIYLARSCDILNAKYVRFFGYSAAFLQGLNYIYFSFFAVVLFVFSGMVGFVQTRSIRVVKEATVASGIVIIMAAINLVPSFLSWAEHGKPPDMSYKSAAEAEVYGLKIRKMFAPHEGNKIPLFKQWGRQDKSSNFPNENENVTARLGPIAAVGLLYLLMVSVGLSKPNKPHDMNVINSLASLALFSVLFTTTGGFGAIFNLFLPDIRAYNRFSVFIAFFALAGLALWWQSRIQAVGSKCHKGWLLTFLMAFFALGLYDQLLDVKFLQSRRAADEISARHERDFVKHIEAIVPADAAVFQLPVTGFPPDGGKELMLPYDHARPYLWSTHLRWSWPSFSLQHRNWIDKLSGQEGLGLAEILVLSKFRLIWVDRYGYTDNGARIISSLLAIGAIDVAPEMSPRYVVMDLANIADQMSRDLGSESLALKQEILLDEPVLVWGRGFYASEHNAEWGTFRWSKAESKLQIISGSKRPVSCVLSFLAASGKTGMLTVSSASQTVSVKLSPEPVRIDFPITLEPNDSVVVDFVGSMGRIDMPPGESRDLHFYLIETNLQYTVESKLK